MTVFSNPDSWETTGNTLTSSLYPVIPLTKRLMSKLIVKKGLIFRISFHLARSAWKRVSSSNSIRLWTNTISSKTWTNIFLALTPSVGKFSKSLCLRARMTLTKRFEYVRSYPKTTAKPCTKTHQPLTPLIKHTECTSFHYHWWRVRPILRSSSASQKLRPRIQRCHEKLLCKITFFRLLNI